MSLFGPGNLEFKPNAETIICLCICFVVALVFVIGGILARKQDPTKPSKGLLFLLFKGSEVSLKKLKVTMYMLFYFLRMVLFLAGILITAIFSFGFISLLEPVPEMANSIWGVVIAYAPMQVIVFVVMKLNHKNTVTIAEQEDKKE